MTTPYYDSGVLADRRRRGPRTTRRGSPIDNATMQAVAGHHTGGSRRRQGLRVRPQHRGLAGAAVRGQCRAGQRALHGRRALHAFGRHLRRDPAGPRARRAGPGPCRGLPGWHLAGVSATIDPVMVPEPALPVVRRATAGRRRADGRPAGPDVLGRPGHQPHLPHEAAPGGRAARLLPDPDAGGLPALRWLLHDRRLRRLGHLGPRRQAAADGAARRSSPWCRCCPTWPRTS